mmetsp:Transcript_9744/g.14290  ORF Transcript_9744/g.14290 Transcript_9744/m.14290 type:complete len:150 (+) Transcript_9744:1139-1588(+)
MAVRQKKGIPRNPRPEEENYEVSKKKGERNFTRKPTPEEYYYSVTLRKGRRGMNKMTTRKKNSALEEEQQSVTPRRKDSEHAGRQSDEYDSAHEENDEVGFNNRVIKLDETLDRLKILTQVVARSHERAKNRLMICKLKNGGKFGGFRI